ncbi:unnamed protein product [Arabidopsis lyrata]|nr:unnamed protein product [Arabidopsis lyrata]
MTMKAERTENSTSIWVIMEENRLMTKKRSGVGDGEREELLDVSTSEIELGVVNVGDDDDDDDEDDDDNASVEIVVHSDNEHQELDLVPGMMTTLLSKLLFIPIMNIKN